MKIDDAFQVFRSRSLGVGVGVPLEELHSGCFGTRFSEVVLYDGKLRLVFDGRDSVLRLNISHGPPGARCNWLTLYRADCVGDVVMQTYNQSLPFEQAVAEGIEVLAPTA